jgi:hypothetical protein
LNTVWVFIFNTKLKVIKLDTAYLWCYEILKLREMNIVCAIRGGGLKALGKMGVVGGRWTGVLAAWFHV